MSRRVNTFWRRCNTISQIVLDRFGWNLVDELSRWREQADLILVKVRMQIRSISGIQSVNCSTCLCQVGSVGRCALMLLESLLCFQQSLVVRVQWWPSGEWTAILQVVADQIQRKAAVLRTWILYCGSWANLKIITSSQPDWKQSSCHQWFSWGKSSPSSSVHATLHAFVRRLYLPPMLTLDYQQSWPAILSVGMQLNA